MASSRAGQFGLVLDLRIELPGRPPRIGLAPPHRRRVVPYTRCDNAARSGHPGHLAEPFDRRSHEVNDELRQRGVEVAVRKRELLGSRLSYIDSWMAFPSGLDERLRGLDCGHSSRPQPFDELGGQSTWATADIEDALPRGDLRELTEPPGQAESSTCP